MLIVEIKEENDNKDWFIKLYSDTSLNCFNCERVINDTNITCNYCEKVNLYNIDIILFSRLQKLR